MSNSKDHDYTNFENGGEIQNEGNIQKEDDNSRKDPKTNKYIEQKMADGRREMADFLRHMKIKTVFFRGFDKIEVFSYIKEIDAKYQEQMKDILDEMNFLHDRELEKRDREAYELQLKLDEVTKEKQQVIDRFSKGKQELSELMDDLGEKLADVVQTVSDVQMSLEIKKDKAEADTVSIPRVITKESIVKDVCR